jgi:hypothetical protein
MFARGLSHPGAAYLTEHMNRSGNCTFNPDGIPPVPEREAIQAQSAWGASGKTGSAMDVRLSRLFRHGDFTEISEIALCQSVCRKCRH